MLWSVAISIPELEQRAALGWRAPEEERLGDWLLRAAGGFTGRANSALALGDPGRPLDEAAGAVRDWYHARGLPAMIAIPYPAGRPQAVAADRFLAEQGWGVRSGAATVMTAPVGQVAHAAGRSPGRSRRDRARARCGLAGAVPLPRPAGAAADCPAGAHLRTLAGVRLNPGGGPDDRHRPGGRGQPLGWPDRHRSRPRAPAPRARHRRHGRARRPGRRAWRPAHVPSGRGRQRARPGAVSPHRLRRASRIPLPPPPGGPRHRFIPAVPAPMSSAAKCALCHGSSWPRET